MHHVTLSINYKEYVYSLEYFINKIKLRNIRYIIY